MSRTRKGRGGAVAGAAARLASEPKPRNLLDAYIEMAQNLGGLFYYDRLDAYLPTQETAESLKPEDIKKSPILMKAFRDQYGPIAESILETFGTVPESVDVTKIWTPEQYMYFNKDGTRAFYSVPELLAMSEDCLAVAGYQAGDILQTYTFLWYFPEKIPNN